ncbi:5-oxoprolinase subunit PxpA [Shewanella litorisediminis]|uniref:5-oxoprolinase subunit PxpA n=1 Tax=Shewanella litorisediminis TaxID=1173586 RepID=A0ABX7G3R2_9GAMM|nr:5-oxoprolinase subunit PxpA [Shewanella litorisediminis]MCL2919941.1 5-oxoprolinase subunit PxpA [Shewanella litorisediminis]QRH01882.1 5-oxoprolinase subunit PxpA [Shewanella litorisediminis]
MASLQLNADVGEGYPFDAEILTLVDAANIACGGHAGDSDSMRITVKLAMASGCLIGAHPSFPDKANFGRQPMSLEATALTTSLVDQIQALKQICDEEGAVMFHVKPHGALYNQAAFDKGLATCLIEAVQTVDANLVLMGLAASPLLQWAREAGLRVQAEAFADRRYEADATLVSRQKPGAVIHDQAEALVQVQGLMSGCLTCIDGTPLRLRADTLCLHGDNPEALQFARRIRALLETSDAE